MGFFGNMMNNYFYGKAGQADYTVQSMPQNRFQLFGAVWKTRWSSMLGVNLLYMLFWLPTLLWSVLHISIFLSSGVEDGLRSYLMMYLLGLIPCIAITGPFTAGFTFVFRNWARDEHSFIWSDFWDAVKANWKLALPISCISSIMPLCVYIGWVFYGSMIDTQGFFFVIPLGLVTLVALIWKLSEMVIYTMMVTYDLKVTELIRNGFLITMARFPLAIGIKLLTWIIPAIGLAVLFFMPEWTLQTIMILMLLYVLYLPAFNRLVVCSYANASCEKYLNVRIDGAGTNIGLRPEDWDDTEYRPEDDEE